MSGFSNLDTEHTALIISNTYDLYVKRNSFDSFKEFEYYYSKQRDIYSFVDMNNVDFKEVFDWFQIEQEL